MLSRSPLETLVQIPFGWNWWFNLVNGVLFLAPLPALQPALQNGGSGHNVPHALEEGVAEWSKARAWRARVRLRTVGSNPTSSATHLTN